MHIITRQVGNLPTKFGVSRTFRSRLIGQHLSDAPRDLTTLTFDLGVTALVSQKEAVYKHTCINAVKIFVRIFGLLIYSPGLSLCRPNNVEFSSHAEKSISNELSTAICTFWPPLVTHVAQ